MNTIFTLYLNSFFNLIQKHMIKIYIYIYLYENELCLSFNCLKIIKLTSVYIILSLLITSTICHCICRKNNIENIINVKMKKIVYS